MEAGTNQRSQEGHTRRASKISVQCLQSGLSCATWRMRRPCQIGLGPALSGMVCKKKTGQRVCRRSLIGVLSSSSMSHELGRRAGGCRGAEEEAEIHGLHIDIGLGFRVQGSGFRVQGLGFKL